LRTIEKAIHHALQKIDTANPAMRHKLYQATWQTHEKMLSSMTQATEIEKSQRRDDLKQIIQSIEAGFQQPNPPTSALPEQPEPSSPLSALPLTADPISSPHRSERRAQSPASKKHSLFRGYGFLLVLVVILLFVAWSFYNSLVGNETVPPADSLSTSDPISSLITQDDAGSFAVPAPPEPAAAQTNRQWVDVFDPRAIESLRVIGAAKVQLHEDENGHFLRLQTQNIEQGIVIEIGRAIIARARGKNALFHITARNSGGGIMTRLGVACDVGAVSACGRWRFELPSTREDLLFGVDMPADIDLESQVTLTLSASGAGAAGGAADDAEQAVDIFSLEVSFDE